MDKKDRQFFAELFRVVARKLDTSFDLLNNKLNTIMTRQSDFDAFIAKFAPAIDQVKADTEALLAKANAADIDLTAEQTTLQASLDALTAIHSEAAGTGTPAPTDNAQNDPSLASTNADPTPATSGS